MAATDVTRSIIVVQILILGLYSVLSDRPMIFASFYLSNVINICKDKQWQHYHASKDGYIQFLTADMKQRVLYWITKNGFFSLALGGNKTVVNLSKKFRNGLAYKGFLHREFMGVIVYDGQIIFAETNWGLIKFDVKTNRKLFNLKHTIKNYIPSYTTLWIDIYDNEVCLYWNGPGEEQISRYLINSNINEVVVQRFNSLNMEFVAVHQEKVYWEDFSANYFSTNMNLQNRQSWISSYIDITYDLIEGIMYYSFHRNISSQLMKTINPLKPYFSCPAETMNRLVVIPASYSLTIQDVDKDIVKRVDENNVEEDAVVEDDVKAGVWSTVGWGLGCGFTLVLLVIICLQLVKMVRTVLIRQPNNNTTENIYDVPVNIGNADHDLNEYSSISLGSKSKYLEVRF